MKKTKNINIRWVSAIGFLVLTLAFYSCQDNVPAATPISPATGLPTITSFSPTAAKVGTVVTITGTNFGNISDNVRVWFNGVPANMTATPAPSATSVSFVVPDSHNGNISLAVAYSNGITVKSTQSFTVITEPTWNFGNRAGVVTDSTGTWDNSSDHWTTDGGITNVAWSATDGRAIFGNGTAGKADTVWIAAGGVTAKSILFRTPNAGNYTLDGGTLTLTTDSVTMAADATIASVIAGTAGLRKLGAGKLTISGANIYTGTTTVFLGVLDASTPGATYSSECDLYVITSDAPATGNSGQLKLPLSPDLTGKTFNIKIDETGTKFGTAAYFPVVWSAGTATGTPTLQVNGVTVTSGVATAGGTTVTFSATDGISVSR